MSAFFFTSDRAEYLRAEASRWVGTPFHDHAQVIGSGVDCVHLAAALYQHAGLISSIEWPAYSMSEGQHSGRSKLVDAARSIPQFSEVYSGAESVQLPGDLLCFVPFRSGQPHHAGVYLGAGEFINSMQTYGVRILKLTPQWQRMLSTVFRPVES